MNILDHWDHKWFGVWREYGPAYHQCPKVCDFVFPEVTLSYDIGRLRQYLTKAPIVASASRNGFPCPFTGKRTGGTISYRTDGRWLWLDDLADYIEQFGVAIPNEWLREIEENGYAFPSSDEIAVESLEWPPVKQSALGLPDD